MIKENKFLLRIEASNKVDFDRNLKPTIQGLELTKKRPSQSMTS